MDPSTDEISEMLNLLKNDRIPERVRSHEDVLALALRGMRTEGTYGWQRDAGLALAAWFVERPGVAAHVRHHLRGEHERSQLLAAAMLLPIGDEDARSIWREAVAEEETLQPLFDLLRLPLGPKAAWAWAEGALMLEDDEDAAGAVMAVSACGDLDALFHVWEEDWRFDVREQVAKELVYFPGQRAEDALCGALDDDNEFLAELAMATLAEIGSPSVVEPVLRGAGHEEGWQMIDPPPGVPMLMDRLCRYQEGADVLRTLAQDADPDVRRLAQIYLYASGSWPEGRALVRQVVDEDDSNLLTTARELAIRLLAEPDSAEVELPKYKAPPQRTNEHRVRSPKWWRQLPAGPSGGSGLFAVVVPEPPKPVPAWVRTPRAAAVELDPDDPWNTLPLVGVLAGYPLRWAGPLVDANLAREISLMSEVAYAFDAPDWMRFIEDLGDTFADGGEVRPEWQKGILRAARALTPSPHDIPQWLAWLCFELAAPHEALKEWGE